VELLKRLLAVFGWERPIRALKAAVVIPWYIQPHLLGGVSIYTDGLVKVVDVGILPAPLLYTQLSTVRPGSLQVFPEVELSCRMGSLKESAKGLACSVASWGLSGAAPWVPPEGAYLIYENGKLTQQILAAKRLASLGCTTRLVELTEYLTPDKTPLSQSVVEVLLRKAVELSEKDPGLITELETLLEAAGPPADLKAQISAKLRALNRLKTLGELNQRFQYCLLTKEDKYEIQITPSGYLYKDLKDNESTQITNHTCQLISQIIFPGVAERYIYVNFSVQDKDHLLTIPESSFENSKKLANYLLTYETNATEPPRVLDTDKHKYALNWFKLRIPRLPVKAGLSFVGWDAQSSREFFFDCCP
jgi:hypothetical protein